MKATRIVSGATLAVIMLCAVVLVPFSAEASHDDNDRRDRDRDRHERYDRHGDRGCSWSWQCGGDNYYYPRQQTYYYQQPYYYQYQYQQPTYYYPTYSYPQATSYSYAQSGGGYYWGW